MDSASPELLAYSKSPFIMSLNLPLFKHLPVSLQRLLLLGTLLTFNVSAMAETWRGLTVTPEYRCSPYSSKDYHYPQSVEPRIIESMGGRIYGPYTGQSYASRRDTDIEHIVARSEAHDSGLCRATQAQRKAFARDLLNLTLASPTVNRHRKVAKDAADWLPDTNQCWFADRVIQVRLKYQLTVDRREAAALEKVLSQCTSTRMVFYESTQTRHTKTRQSNLPANLQRYDDNRNGRITCKEARRHGIAPVARTHPAYRYMHDGDGDGVVCE